MTTNQSTAVSPGKASVAELATWLSQFGDNNRRHFENAQIQNNAHRSSIQQKVRMFENRSHSGSSSATSVASPPGKRSAFVPKTLMHAKLPVSRNFAPEDSMFPHTAEEWHDGLSVEDLEHFRVVAITKLLEPPQPHRCRDSLQSWDASDDFSDPWPVPTWHPNASPSHLEDDEARTNCNDNEDDHSAVTGRFTDPGARSSRRGRIALQDSKRKTHRPSTFNATNGAILTKLPLLMCKSNQGSGAVNSTPSRHVGKATRNMSSTSSPTTAAAPESPHERELNNLFTQSTTLFDSSAFAPSAFNTPPSTKNFLPKYQTPRILSEENNVSTWGDDSIFVEPKNQRRAVNANLGDVFAEELELEGRTKLHNKGGSKVMAGDGHSTKQGPEAVTTQFSSAMPRTESAFTPFGNSSSMKKSGVSSVVAQFGGHAKPYKKSLVQLRQEQIAAKQAKDRGKNRSSKSLWQKDSNSGGFKKRFQVVENSGK